MFLFKQELFRNLVCVHVDPHEEDELGHEEAAAQVLVDCGPGALDLAEEPEGEDTHGQTDEGDDHPQLSDPGQDSIVGRQLRSEWKERCFIHRFMVCWSCNLLFFLLGIPSYDRDGGQRPLWTNRAQTWY